ncbi:MAG: hypothetical protein IKC54_05215 [Clostridia bacterium]|nr:hypothetical protein [Clostridia bacterium]
MKNKFKAYLEEKFREIRPTEAAMKFREQTLVELLERAQELKIKGIEDEELVYLTCIDELGDFDTVLKEFDAKQIETKATKRKIGVGAAIALALIAMLTVTYLVVGFVTHIWHPTWLIMVGGLFAGAGVGMLVASIKLIRAKKFLPVRAMLALIEIMASVFTFLLLQLVFHLDGSWMTFLAMVVLILGADTGVAFLTSSKAKWFELPVFVEVFAVMLFVILGIVTTVWHPTWLLCLIGVVFVIVEVAVALAIRHNRKSKEEDKKNKRFHKEEDEEYWTKWND